MRKLSRPGGVSGTRSDRARETLAAAFVVAALILVAHSGTLLSGERYYFRDLSQNHGPVFEAARALLASGEVPWWNPWSAGGKPLLANPNALLLSPAGLIAVLAPGGPTAAILLGALLAPVFLVLLLRDLGRSGWAAAAGGLAYGLSGFAMSLGTLPNLLAASSWVPAALFFLRRARERPVWIPAAVAACAFVLVPCEPVSALVLVVFAFLSLGGIRAVPPRPVRTAVLLALGAGAAAYEIVPAASWILSSARGTGLPISETSKWSLSLLRLPELVAPGFLGDPSRLASWWSAPLFETGYPLLLSLHVGVPVLLLATWGTWSSFKDRRPDVSRWAGLSVPLAGLGFLVLATGGIVSILMRWIPGADLFRYPEKLVLGFVLALAFQSAVGVDRLLRQQEMGLSAIPIGGSAPLLSDVLPGSNGSLAGGWPSFLVMSSAGAALILLVASALAGPWIVGRWFALPESATAFRAYAAGGVQMSLVLGAVGACLLLLIVLLVRRAPVRWGGGIALAGLAASLLIGALLPGGRVLPWRVRANPSAPATMLDQGPFFADRIAHLASSGGRIFRDERPAGFAVRNRTGTLADLFTWERRTLARSSSGAFGAELVYDRSTDRLDPRGEEAARERIEGRPLATQKRFWDLASVRLVLSYAPLEAPGLTLVDRIEGESLAPLLLYENAGALPRVRLVDRARLTPSDDAALEEIASSSAESWRTAVLVSGDSLPPTSAVAGRLLSASPPPDSLASSSLVSASLVSGSLASDSPPPGSLVSGSLASGSLSNASSASRSRVSPVSPGVPLALEAARAEDPEGRSRRSELQENAGETSEVLLDDRRSTADLSLENSEDRAERGADRPPKSLDGSFLSANASPIDAPFDSRDPGETQADGRVVVLERRPARLRIAIGQVSPAISGGSASVPGAPRDEWLVVGENDVPGWRATMDGAAVPILRANGMFMAIPVRGAGSHVAELRFLPPGLYSGLAVSLLAILLSVAMAARWSVDQPHGAIVEPS